MWVALLLFSIILALFFYFDTKKPKNFPPGPAWWPILGSCLEVEKFKKHSDTLQEATDKLAKKYGPVIGLKVGKDLTVVVCNYRLIKKFLVDEDFNGRPHGIFYRLRTWGNRRGLLLTDQEFWQEQRRFVLRQLREFGFGKRNMSVLIEDEVEGMVAILNQKIEKNRGSVVIQMDEFFSIHVFNTLWSMMAGTRYNHDDMKVRGLQKLLTFFLTKVDMVGALFSHFPILRFIAPEYSGYKIYMDTHKKIWKFLNFEIENHKETFDSNNLRDLIDVYLKMLMSPEKKESFSEKQLMAICLDLFIAGSETTSKSLGFAFVYFVLHPEIQIKCQEEIDNVIGRNRLPSLNDRPSMVYMEATVLEAIRHFSGRSFTVPHRAVKDSYLEEYFIPKDTIILANLRILLNEESGFSEPGEFKPERFIKDDRLVVPENFIPFGFGKHRCLGETLAKANLFLIIAGLLQNFYFSIVPGLPPTTNSTAGATPGPIPYKVLVTPRTNKC